MYVYVNVRFVKVRFWNVHFCKNLDWTVSVLYPKTNANSQKCTQAYSPHPAHKFPEKSTWNESFMNHFTLFNNLCVLFSTCKYFSIFFSLEENLKIIKNLFFVFLTFNFCFSVAPWGQILRIFKVSHLYVKKNLKWKKISSW